MIKNYRAVLRADIRPLAVQRGRVVQIPENIKQLIVRNNRGIELNQDRFGVAGRTAADLFVSGIFSMTAGIADGGVDDPFNFPEFIFDAPETTGSKGSFLRINNTSPYRKFYTIN